MTEPTVCPWAVSIDFRHVTDRSWRASHSLYPQSRSCKLSTAEISEIALEKKMFLCVTIARHVLAEIGVRFQACHTFPGREGALVGDCSPTPTSLNHQQVFTAVCSQVIARCWDGHQSQRLRSTLILLLHWVTIYPGFCLVFHFIYASHLRQDLCSAVLLRCFGWFPADQVFMLLLAMLLGMNNFSVLYLFSGLKITSRSSIIIVLTIRVKMGSLRFSKLFYYEVWFIEFSLIHPYLDDQLSAEPKWHTPFN